MNAECAMLNLMSMGVPPELAECIGHWITRPGGGLLVYMKYPTEVEMGGGRGIQMSHYGMRYGGALDCSDWVVWHPNTGFNPDFRHPERR